MSGVMLKKYIFQLPPALAATGAISCRLIDEARQISIVVGSNQR